MKPFNRMTSAEQAAEVENTWKQIERDIRFNFLHVTMATLIIGIGAGISFFVGNIWMTITGGVLAGLLMHIGAKETIDITDRYSELVWIHGYTGGKEAARLEKKIYKKESAKKKKTMIK